MSNQGQGCEEDSSANVIGSTSAADKSHGVSQSSIGNGLKDLSGLLRNQWTTVEQGLNLIDGLIKSYVDGVAQGSHRPPFIHHCSWDHNRRPLVLVEAMAVAQLYATTTPQSDAVLLRSIQTQLISLQQTVSVNSPECEVETDKQR